jgi:hypothetical protein
MGSQWQQVQRTSGSSLREGWQSSDAVSQTDDTETTGTEAGKQPVTTLAGEGETITLAYPLTP